MFPPCHGHPEDIRRRALAKVYALLMQLSEEKQTALPEHFGEQTGKAEEKTPTEVEASDD
jgi:hypothetical protein